MVFYFQYVKSSTPELSYPILHRISALSFLRSRFKSRSHSRTLRNKKTIINVTIIVGVWINLFLPNNIWFKHQISVVEFDWWEKLVFYWWWVTPLSLRKSKLLFQVGIDWRSPFTKFRHRVPSHLCWFWQILIYFFRIIPILIILSVNSTHSLNVRVSLLPWEQFMLLSNLHAV